MYRITVTLKKIFVLIQYQQRRNSYTALTKKHSSKEQNINSIPPSKLIFLAEPSVTRFQQNTFSYLSPTTVVTRKKHIENPLT